MRTCRPSSFTFWGAGHRKGAGPGRYWHEFDQVAQNAGLQGAPLGGTTVGRGERRTLGPGWATLRLPESSQSEGDGLASNLTHPLSLSGDANTAWANRPRLPESGPTSRTQSKTPGAHSPPITDRLPSCPLLPEEPPLTRTSSGSGCTDCPCRNQTQPRARLDTTGHRLPESRHRAPPRFHQGLRNANHILTQRCQRRSDAQARHSQLWRDPRRQHRDRRDRCVPS